MSYPQILSTSCRIPKPDTSVATDFLKPGQHVAPSSVVMDEQEIWTASRLGPIPQCWQNAIVSRYPVERRDDRQSPGSNLGDGGDRPLVKVTIGKSPPEPAASSHLPRRTPIDHPLDVSLE